MLPWMRAVSRRAFLGFSVSSGQMPGPMQFFKLAKDPKFQEAFRQVETELVKAGIDIRSKVRVSRLGRSCTNCRVRNSSTWLNSCTTIIIREPNNALCILKPHSVDGRRGNNVTPPYDRRRVSGITLLPYLEVMRSLYMFTCRHCSVESNSSERGYKERQQE